MKLALGNEVYVADSAAVIARGATYTQAELAQALRHRLPPIVHDDPGQREAAAALAKAATTNFELGRIQQVLSRRPAVEDWRVGEAIAEAFLVDHRACEFPWPHGRDVRNPNASAAGADLVGFHHDAPGAVRLAFGEVKTSSHSQTPPSVMQGRSGLVHQLELLRDSAEIKNHLLRYLSLRSPSATWETTFRTAASRYLRDCTDVSLYGVLVRDVTPSARDVGRRAAALAKKCPSPTLIELRVKYLPQGAIATLAAQIGPPRRAKP